MATHISQLPMDDRIDITLAGCGGTGSMMLSQLARIHTALLKLGGKGIHVTAYDGDTVSDANIGRQLFYPYDIDRNKAVTLITRINAAYGFDWKAKPEMLKSIPYKADMLISCVDSVKARHVFYKDSKKSSYTTYWLDCGNTQSTGQIILGQNSKNKPKEILPSILDLYPNLDEFEEDSGPSCSLAEALASQDLFINSTVSNFAGQLLWQLFRYGKLDHHGYFIDLKAGRTTPLKVCEKTWQRMGYTNPS